jgi:hypothetical protein
MKNLSNFCDLSCRYASAPNDEGLDGSRSCMTFTAIYCTKKKLLAQKSMPCPLKQSRRVRGKPS